MYEEKRVNLITLYAHVESLLPINMITEEDGFKVRRTPV